MKFKVWGEWMGYGDAKEVEADSAEGAAIEVEQAKLLLSRIGNDCGKSIVFVRPSDSSGPGPASRGILSDEATAIIALTASKSQAVVPYTIRAAAR